MVMPTYEYFCSHCNALKEIVHKMSDPDCEICPDCQKASLTKQISRSFAVQFQGSGFYCTDYQKNPSCSDQSCCSCAEKSLVEKSLSS